jgi:hypothetical protein
MRRRDLIASRDIPRHYAEDDLNLDAAYTCGQYLADFQSRHSPDLASV